MLSGSPKWMRGPAAMFVGTIGLIGIVWMSLHFLTIPALRNAIQGDKALAWPSTSGLLTELKRRYADKGSYTLFRAEFQVGGESYVCTQFWAGFHEQGPTSLARNHKVGDPSEVFYDPTDPTQSCLNPGVKKDAGWVALLGLAPIALLLGALIWNGTSRRGWA